MYKAVREEVTLNLDLCILREEVTLNIDMHFKSGSNSDS